MYIYVYPSLILMNNRSCVLLFFFTLSVLSYAQNTTNIWYFGVNAGLDFNSGTPVALTNGQLNSFEGSASIADNSGNLLFYSDGIDIWNRNHITMPNGTGLLGNWDATQSGVIVQKPGSTNLYYVFAVDDEAGPDGITYSEVDMNLASGLGDVTATKNVLLTTPSTEKLTAVRHCNKKDIWIITHDWNSNTFRTFLFTSTGINPVPVLSSVGAVHTGPGWNTNGYLKASPDGSRLALAACHGMNIFELFDFNNSTGVVSNVVPLASVASTYGAYGVEFSPDGTKLYGTTILPGRLLQFDLCAGSAAAINNSRIIIDSTTIYFLGALQLGPDKKIYVSPSADSLCVINFPNASGVSCNYVEGAIPLGGRSAAIGLPNFVTSLFDPVTSINSFSLSCLTDSFNISDTNCLNPYPVNSFLWNFGDASSGASNTSTSSNTTHIFSSAGTYSVSLILNYSCSSDTIYHQVNLQTFSLAPSTLQHLLCFGDSNGVATAPASIGGISPFNYLWLPSGNTNQSLSGLQAGTYAVVISDSINCVNTATVIISQPNILSATTFSTSVCSGNNLSLSAGATGGTQQYNFQWSPSAGISSSTGSSVIFNSTNNTIYTITVTDANGCTDTTHININIFAVPQAIITGDSLICFGENAILSAAGGGTYSWNNGATDISINVNPIMNTNYTLTVFANGCSDSTQFLVSLLSLNTNAGADVTIIKGANTTLQATGGGTYLWNNGETTSSIVVTPTITTSYCVYATNNIGCHDTDCVMITVEDPCGFILVPNAFSPNEDGQNDLLTLIGTCVEELKFTIFDRWGETVFETKDISISWDGKYKSSQLNTAVFFYSLYATLHNGEEISKYGNINLIK